MDLKKINPNLLIIAGVGIFGYSAIIKPLLETIGLKDSREDKERDALLEQAKNNEGWDPSFYKRRVIPVLLLKQDRVNFIASEIYKSWSWWDDDEERVYSAFRLIPDKMALSQVSEAYINLYKADLYYTLDDKLLDSEMAIVSAIVNKMPAFRKA